MELTGEERRFLVALRDGLPLPWTPNQNSARQRMRRVRYAEWAPGRKPQWRLTPAGRAALDASKRRG